MEKLFAKIYALVNYVKSDKQLHFLYGFVISCLTVKITGLPILGFVVAFLFGLAKEYIDKHLPNNKFDWKDMVVTAIGGLIYALIHII